MTGPMTDGNVRQDAGKIPTSRKTSETWGTQTWSTQNLVAGSQIVRPAQVDRTTAKPDSYRCCDC
jgi:hypothetical protein